MIVHHREGVAATYNRGEGLQAVQVWSDKRDWKALRPCELERAQSTPFTENQLRDLIDAVRSVDDGGRIIADSPPAIVAGGLFGGHLVFGEYSNAY